MHRRVGDAARSDLSQEQVLLGNHSGHDRGGSQRVFSWPRHGQGGIENQEKGAFTDWRINFFQIFHSRRRYAK